jgi:hypothetical protein
MGFLDDLLGNTSADAAKAAAADTYKKQQSATKGITEFGDTQPGAFNQLSQAYQPYTQAGGSALQQLLAGLGLGGEGSQEGFTRAYQGLPGYQSGLDTGLTGASRALNAGNMGQSGKALKSLYRFGSDYENQRSGDYLNRLTGLAGMGQQATGAQVGTQAQGLQNQLATRQSAYGGNMQSAGTIGQGDIAAAQAQQQGATNIMGTVANLAGMAMGGMGGLGGLGGMMGMMPSTSLPIGSYQMPQFRR